MALRPCTIKETRLIVECPAERRPRTVGTVIYGSRDRMIAAARLFHSSGMCTSRLTASLGMRQKFPKLIALPGQHIEQ